MFKMNLSTTTNFVSSGAGAGIHQPQSSGHMSLSFKGGVARSPAQMNMNIANLKNSRGCSSCGK
jgi:hypothetical protein